MEKISVYKIGGELINNEKLLSVFLEYLAKKEGNNILVHGGGKTLNELAKRMSVPIRMHDGRRITDKDTIPLVAMVYGGLVNKTIVSKLQNLGCNAIGLSGIDANLIEVNKRPVKEIDYGYVGDVAKVNQEQLSGFIKMGLTPVFCSLTGTDGNFLNTNADTIASEIAQALHEQYEVELYYLFEHNGVLRNINDSNSVISELEQADYLSLKLNNIINKGMIPKLDNAYAALNAGVRTVAITSPESLINNGIKTSLS